MRTRNRGSDYSESYDRGSLWFSNWKEEPPEPTIGSYQVNRSDKETMTDQLTANYFNKVKSGKPLPVNPMSSRSIEVLLDSVNLSTNMRKTNSDGSITGHKGLIRGACPGDLYFRDFPLGQADSSAELVSALAKANTDAWDLLTFVAEYHKTADLVRGAGSRILRRQNKIIDLMRKRKRSHVPTTKEISSEFSDMWLEYRYGWRTMMYDIEDAHGAYDSLFKDAREYIRATETSTITPPPYVEYFDASGAVVQGRRTHEFSREIRAGVGIEVFLDSPVSVDPVTTAYELTPWSFVADWFFNVGDNLTAFSPFANGNLAWAFTTITDVTTTTVDLRTAKFANERGLSGGVNWFTGAVFRRTTKTRTPSNPTFNVQFRPNLNLAKGVDLMALATQIFARKQRALSRLANRR